MTRAPTGMELRCEAALKEQFPDHFRRCMSDPMANIWALKFACVVIRAMRVPTPDMEAKMRTLVMTPGHGGKHWYAAAIDAASPPEEGEVVGPAGLEPATRPL